MEEFFNGNIVIYVKSLEQSKFLIKLTKKHSIPRNNYMEMINEEIYLTHPFYSLKEGIELQANKKVHGDVFGFNDKKIIEFNDIFKLV